jgi:glucosamine-6-phosphate deaminase
MRVDVKQNYDQMSLSAANHILKYVTQKPNSLLCFAAGSTPISTFKYLVALAKEQNVSFANCRFVGLDEWVGLDKTVYGSCYEMLYRDFFNPMGILPSQLVFFDALSDDLQGECKRVDEYLLTQGPIDLILLGIGVNGHLGFNEPGEDSASLCHLTTLNDITISVGQKYFKEHKKLGQGITLGMKHIMNSDTVLLVASGDKKAHAIHRMLHEKVTEELPASLLQNHLQCQVIIDYDAARWAAK